MLSKHLQMFKSYLGCRYLCLLLWVLLWLINAYFLFILCDLYSSLYLKSFTVSVIRERNLRPEMSGFYIFFASWAFISVNRNLQKQNNCTAAPCLRIQSIYSRYSWILPRSFFFFFVKIRSTVAARRHRDAAFLCFKGQRSDSPARLGKSAYSKEVKQNRSLLLLYQLLLFPWAACLNPAAAQYFHLYLVYYHMILLHEALRSEASDAF